MFTLRLSMFMKGTRWEKLSSSSHAFLQCLLTLSIIFSSYQLHCMKSIQILSFSGLYFPVFGLNTEIYFTNLCIQSKCRKIWTRKNSVFRHFSRSIDIGKDIYLIFDSVKEYQWLLMVYFTIYIVVSSP